MYCYHVLCIDDSEDPQNEVEIYKTFSRIVMNYLRAKIGKWVRGFHVQIVVKRMQEQTTGGLYEKS